MSSEGINMDFVRKMEESVAKSNIEGLDVIAFQLAMLFSEFKPEQLKLEFNKAAGYSLSQSKLEVLLENCVFNDKKQTYCLLDSVRKTILTRMSSGEVQKLITTMALQDADPRQQLLIRMVQGQVTQPGDLSPSEYVHAHTYSQWMRGPNIKVLPADSILKLIRQNDLTSPLKKLTLNFNGRTEELDTMQNFISGTVNQPDQSPFNFLFITGVGGIGKSTLVSKFILQQLVKTDQPSPPFINIDFDVPEFTVSDIFHLIKEGLRQIALQKPQYEDRFNAIIDTIKFEYENLISEKSVSRGSERQLFYVDSLSPEDRNLLIRLPFPVIVVFDSFEEVQFRSTPSEITTLFQFLNEVIQFIPTLKIIFIGRADIMDEEPSALPLDLVEFDQPNAISFLNSLHITDERLTTAIFNKFGGNPLTLQLAANLAIKEFGKSEITYEEVERNGIFEKIDKHLIQQQLVARNLEHIHNKELAAIAVPGILLRKINAAIIREVLAEVCGLGSIDQQKAEELFEELKKETFLLKQKDNEVEFRKDLRISLYDLVLKEPKYKAFQIHRAAIEYYNRRPDPSDRAEYLYHRLKQGDDIAIIEALYQEDMKPFLKSALSELPPDAQVELSRLMNVNAGKTAVASLTPEKWELYILSQIRNILEFGDLQQLETIRQKLILSPKRTGNNEFLYFERLVNTRLMTPEKPDIKDKFPEVSDNYNLIQYKISLILLNSYRAEIDFQFDRSLSLLETVQPLIQQLPARQNNLGLLLDFFFAACRLSRRKDKYEIDLTALCSIICDHLVNLPEAAKMTYGELFSFFPKQYEIACQERLKTDDPEIKLRAKADVDPELNKILLEKVLLECLGKAQNSHPLMTAGEVADTLALLSTNVQTIAELERYCRRKYKVFLRDISMPGILNVCMYDFLLFAEFMPRKTFRLELEKLTVASNFYGMRNIVTSEAFTSLAGVQTCLEKLDATFSKNPDKKLIVSDVLDGEGNQYVNLVQRSSGVHHFALLGYTYILEKRGIRFLKLAGTNTAAINTALLGIAGKKEEENSITALDHLLKRDYFSLVDGPKLLRRLITRITRKKNRNFLLTLMSRIYGYLLLIVFFIIGDSILLGLKEEDSSFSLPFTIFLIASLVVYLFSIYWVISIWMQVQNVLRFGAGLNPGKELHRWIKSIFESCNISTNREFKNKAQETPILHTRNGISYNTELLRSDITFACADVISQNKIYFPAMAPLFWQDAENVDPSVFVRASAGIPLFFSSYEVKKLPVEDPIIRQAWLEQFGEFEPPPNVNFVDAGFNSPFPIDIFHAGTAHDAPLPTFGVDTVQTQKQNDRMKQQKPGWISYISRLMNIHHHNPEKTKMMRVKAMEKGICNIRIENVLSINFLITDEEKLDLFTKGAQTATEFLINFDWESYKKQLNSPGALRL